MEGCVRAVVVRNNNILLIKRNKYGERYYTLPGGHIEPGETAETAVMRELREEASLTIGPLQLVFIEEAGQPFGTQYIFVAEYVDGDVALHADSDEAIQNAGGQNTYQPLWVPVSKLGRMRLLSPLLKQTLLRALADGFPREPKILVPRPT